MNYDRKVKYFDYKKDGERLRGAGFAKMEVRGGDCKLQIQISGLHMTDTFSKQVYLVAVDREEVLGSIELQGGKGSLQKQLAVDNLCNGVSYGDLTAIRIPIAAGYELYCRVREGVVPESNRQVAEVAVVSEVEQLVDTMSISEAEEPVDVMSISEIAHSVDVVSSSEGEPFAEVVNMNEIEQTTDAQVVATTEQCADKAEDINVGDINARDINARDNESPDDNAPQTMLSTKWQQLSAIYPHIQPFQDDRDYLKVGPEDFVVLGRRSYQLAHNSFLLHGYYNYKHLILTRHDWRNEERYYIGVPGNFYEREKQVALMFGFESFECQEEPAAMGAYGYYMIRVDI